MFADATIRSLRNMPEDKMSSLITQQLEQGLIAVLSSMRSAYRDDPEKALKMLVPGGNGTFTGEQGRKGSRAEDDQGGRVRRGTRCAGSSGRGRTQDRSGLCRCRGQGRSGQMTSRAKNALSGLLGPGKSKRGQAVRFSRSAPPAPLAGAREQVCGGDGEGGRGRLFAVEVPAAFKPLYRPARYKVYWGGRGAAKSWAFADAFITLGVGGRYRFLCARELQVSIADSVHKLLADRIAARGLDEFFRVTDTATYRPPARNIFSVACATTWRRSRALKGWTMCGSRRRRRCAARAGSC